jgi:hypothetical protein
VFDTGPIPIPAPNSAPESDVLSVLEWRPECGLAVQGPRKPATAALIVTCPVGHVTVDLMCTAHASLMSEVASETGFRGRCTTCAEATRLEVRAL